jgi:hypothetical protein
MRQGGKSKAFNNIISLLWFYFYFILYVLEKLDMWLFELGEN